MSRLALFALFTFTLAACSSAGGGGASPLQGDDSGSAGGGETPGSPEALYSYVPADKQFSPSFKSTGDGAELSLPDGSIIWFSATRASSPDPRHSLMEASAGSTTAAIMLGGNKLGLEHSEFGIWMYKQLEPLNLLFKHGVESFAVGNPAKSTGVNAVFGNTLTFSGNAVAQLKRINDGQDDGARLVGDALFIVSKSDNSASLTMDFGKEGKIKAEDIFMDILGGLFFYDPPYTNISVEGFAGFGAVSGNSSLKGQLYGKNPDNATEGVGTFLIRNLAEEQKITGAFGLKR